MVTCTYKFLCCAITHYLQTNIIFLKRGFYLAQKLYFYDTAHDSRPKTKTSSEDEIANVNGLRRHRTCKGQSLRPLN